jgi:hypothetical protein
MLTKRYSNFSFVLQTTQTLLSVCTVVVAFSISKPQTSTLEREFIFIHSVFHIFLFWLCKLEVYSLALSMTVCADIKINNKNNRNTNNVTYIRSFSKSNNGKYKNNNKEVPEDLTSSNTLHISHVSSSDNITLTELISFLIHTSQLATKE